MSAGAPVAPGRWLGVLGGGQLGRMFAQAAQRLGYRVCVLDPDPASPAGTLADRHLQADYLDAEALATLGSLCEAVTTEFENVPAQALRALAARTRVHPSADCVAVAQDRIAEKTFAQACGLATAPFAPVRSPQELDALAAAGGAGLLPGILKAARLGYDGKGQARVDTVEQLRAAFAAMGGVPCVLEARLALQAEASVVLARGADGDVRALPVARNVHRDGILAVTTVPAGLEPQLEAQAVAAATTMAERLGYVGVLCVEFFVVDGGLRVNEIAPRPHNSGHWSLDAATSTQFEQQVRALAGLPLGDAQAMRPAVMLNLLGDLWFAPGASAAREPDWAAVLAIAGAKLHLYGKAEPRPGRKMGHLTLLGDDPAQAHARAVRAAAILGLPAP